MSGNFDNLDIRSFKKAEKMNPFLAAQTESLYNSESDPEDNLSAGMEVINDPNAMEELQNEAKENYEQSSKTVWQKIGTFFTRERESALVTQGGKIVYNTIASPIGAKALIDWSLYGATKLGRKLGFKTKGRGDVNQYFAENNMERALLGITNKAIELKKSTEAGKEAEDRSLEKGDYLKSKIELMEATKNFKARVDEMNVPESKKKELRKQLAEIMTEQKKAEAGIEKGQSEKFDRTMRKYIGSKVNAFRLGKDALNSALTLTGFYVVRVGSQATFAALERGEKEWADFSRKSFEKEPTGSSWKKNYKELSGAKMGKVLKGITWDSSKETFNELVYGTKEGKADKQKIKAEIKAEMQKLDEEGVSRFGKGWKKIKMSSPLILAHMRAMGTIIRGLSIAGLGVDAYIHDGGAFKAAGDRLLDSLESEGLGRTLTDNMFHAVDRLSRASGMVIDKIGLGVHKAAGLLSAHEANAYTLDQFLQSQSELAVNDAEKTRLLSHINNLKQEVDVLKSQQNAGPLPPAQSAELNSKEDLLSRERAKLADINKNNNVLQAQIDTYNLSVNLENTLNNPQIGWQDLDPETQKRFFSQVLGVKDSTDFTDLKAEHLQKLKVLSGDGKFDQADIPGLKEKITEIQRQVFTELKDGLINQVLNSEQIKFNELDDETKKEFFRFFGINSLENLSVKDIRILQSFAGKDRVYDNSDINSFQKQIVNAQFHVLSSKHILSSDAFIDHIVPKDTMLFLSAKLAGHNLTSEQQDEILNALKGDTRLTDNLKEVVGDITAQTETIKDHDNFTKALRRLMAQDDVTDETKKAFIANVYGKVGKSVNVESLEGKALDRELKNAINRLSIADMGPVETNMNVQNLVHQGNILKINSETGQWSVEQGEAERAAEVRSEINLRRNFLAEHGLPDYLVKDATFNSAGETIAHVSVNDRTHDVIFDNQGKWEAMIDGKIIKGEGDLRDLPEKITDAENPFYNSNFVTENDSDVQVFSENINNGLIIRYLDEATGTGFDKRVDHIEILDSYTGERIYDGDVDGSRGQINNFKNEAFNFINERIEYLDKLESEGVGKIHLQQADMDPWSRELDQDKIDFLLEHKNDVIKAADSLTRAESSGVDAEKILDHYEAVRDLSDNTGELTTRAINYLESADRTTASQLVGLTPSAEAQFIPDQTGGGRVESIVKGFDLLIEKRNDGKLYIGFDGPNRSNIGTKGWFGFIKPDTELTQDNVERLVGKLHAQLGDVESEMPAEKVVVTENSADNNLSSDVEVIDNEVVSPAEIENMEQASSYIEQQLNSNAGIESFNFDFLIKGSGGNAETFLQDLESLPTPASHAEALKTISESLLKKAYQALYNNDLGSVRDAKKIIYDYLEARFKQSV